MKAYTRVVSALETRGCTGRGASWQCPAHDDRAPSLSVNLNSTGDGVVLYCHAQCDTADVMAALDLGLGDLYDEPLTAARTDKPQVVAEYPYHDETGQLLYVVKRLEPGYDGAKKTFRQYAADGTPGTKDIRKVPYNLAAVLTQAAAGGSIYVAEGEKDVDRLTTLGIVATTNVGGAGKWNDSYSKAFVGASEVVVIADKDKPGRKHAVQVAASLRRAGVRTRIVEPGAGKDVSEHIAYGLGSDALVPAGYDQELQAAHDPSPPDEPNESVTDPVAALIAELLDTDDLDKIPNVRPLVEDMLFLDTLGRINGPSGHGKSFVSLDLAGCVGTGEHWHGKSVHQGLVLYLVAEGAAGVRKRVRAWEQIHGLKMTGVKFLPRPIQAMDPEWGVLIEACRRLEPVLIIIDTQARVTVGVEENSATEMGKVVHRMEQLRAASGACVLLIHHKGLNGDQGRGSSAVKGALQSELSVTKAGNGPDTKVTVGTDKQKDSEEIGKLVFQLKQVALDGEAEEDGRPVTSAVLLLDESDIEPAPTKMPPAAKKLLGALRTLDRPANSKDVVDRLAAQHNHGLTRQVASKHLNALYKDGLVNRDEHLDGTVLWQINDKGRDHSP